MSDGPVMTLRVRNVLGVQKADLTLGQVILVGGVNGAGKSSLLESAACAFLGTALTRGASNKKVGADLLREGSDAGSVLLDYGVGSQRVAWPACEVQQQGKPLPLGTALGIGTAAFMALKPEHRVREIASRFDLNPIFKDVQAWAAARPEANIKDSALGALWEKIEQSGWDATDKAAREHGTKCKGAWEQITGKRWGEQIARSWAPEGLHADEQYDVDAVQQMVAAAQAELEATLKQTAVSSAERQRMQGEADGWAAASAEVQRLAEEAKQIDAQLERLVAERQGMEEPPPERGLIPCPHCAQTIYARKISEAEWRFEKPPPAMAPAKLKALRTQISDIEGKIHFARVEAQVAAQHRVKAAQALQRATEAARWIAENDDRPVADDAAVEAARAKWADLDRRARAIADLHAAQRKVREWDRHKVILELLHPDGVRKQVMKDKLGEINTLLAEFCSVAKFEPIELDEDMAATYGKAKRRYELISESERWRVDLVLTALFCQREGSPVILVDRLDVIDPKRRGDVLMLLKHLRTPAIVAMTQPEPGVMPNLKKFKLGVSMWLEGGVLTPIE